MIKLFQNLMNNAFIFETDNLIVIASVYAITVPIAPVLVSV